MEKSLIISLGGSLIVPDAIDTAFLSSFREVILRHLPKYKQIFLVTGGGKTARHYQEAAKQLQHPPVDDLDWLGIHASRLNGHLMRTIFADVADPEMITNPERMVERPYKVIIAAGYRPGHSTDYVATMLARAYGVKQVLNLSNIDYVYDKDPRKFKDAKRLETISWADFRKMVGDKWIPGQHVPFDPIAAKLGEELGLSVRVMNGTNLEALDAVLAGGKAKGSVIAP